MNKPPGTLWNDRQIEARWGKRRGFMSDLRAKGQGPRFLRLSARTIRYREEDLCAYEDAQIDAAASSDFKAPASSVESVESPPIRKRTAFDKPAWKPSGRRGRLKKIEMFAEFSGSRPEHKT